MLTIITLKYLVDDHVIFKFVILYFCNVLSYLYLLPYIIYLIFEMTETVPPQVLIDYHKFSEALMELEKSIVKLNEITPEQKAKVIIYLRFLNYIFR